MDVSAPAARGASQRNIGQEITQFDETVIHAGQEQARSPLNRNRAVREDEVGGEQPRSLGDRLTDEGAMRPGWWATSIKVVFIQGSSIGS
jgi:hypothetical protein